MDYQRLLVKSLPVVDAIVASIARRHRLSADETGELGASVRLKLVDRDYEVLRRFKGQSSLKTYLTAVITRHFLDARTAAWGKWRPCALANRIGPHAALLDRLMTRDGLTADNAIARVLATFDVSRSDLEALAARLPQRTTRRLLGEEELAELASGESEKDLVDSMDKRRHAAAVRSALSAALAQLGAEDCLVLKMRFWDGFTVARISQTLQIEQAPLYRRVSALLAMLRRELEARGVSAAFVATLDDAEAELPTVWDRPGDAGEHADGSSARMTGVGGRTS